MTMIRRCLLPAVVLCLLTGCATSSTDSGALFLLQQPPHQSTVRAASIDRPQAQTVLVLAEVALSPYLTHDGIVYQTGPNRIVVADSNRWAAPLAAQLREGLYYALDRGLSGIDVRRPGRATQPAYRLIVHIERFQGRYDGMAVINGNWRLFNRDNQVIGRGDFARTTPLKTDGYAALVRALSRGWEKVKARMVRAINAELKP